jgi:hypothetical protein
LLGIIPPVQGSVPEKLTKKAAVVSDYAQLPQEIYVRDLLILLGDTRNAFVKKII